MCWCQLRGFESSLLAQLLQGKLRGRRFVPEEWSQLVPALHAKAKQGFSRAREDSVTKRETGCVSQRRCLWVSFHNGARWNSRRAVFILTEFNILISPVDFIDLVLREG